MNKIIPFLWFDNQAEEAVEFYTSVFKNARVTNLSRYGDGTHMPKGSVMTIHFELDGQKFIALNGGPVYTFSPAISLFVNCETSEDVNHLWDKLSDGGEKQRCGWLKDKFGITWQSVPEGLGSLLGHPDAEKAKKAIQAMMKMDKLDLDAMKEAMLM